MYSQNKILPPSKQDNMLLPVIRHSQNKNVSVIRHSEQDTASVGNQTLSKQDSALLSVIGHSQNKILPLSVIGHSQNKTLPLSVIGHSQNKTPCFCQQLVHVLSKQDNVLLSEIGHS